MINQVSDSVARRGVLPRVLALSGGVGGAKLALGLAKSVPGPELMVVANTADDFRHLGVHISPDIDTLLYTLADMNNPTTGWGQRHEQWSFMDALATLSPEESWFKLGDRDLATHLFRTAQLERGISLSRVTQRLADAFGVGTQVVPMCDEPVATYLQVALEGRKIWLPFQEYFVKLKTEPVVCDVAYRGIESSTVPASVRAALSHEALQAVVICPSNPYLSIDPILSVPGMSDLIREARVPVVAVSPLVGGQAIKGPTAKMMAEMALAPNALSIARHYKGMIDGLVLDRADVGEQGDIEARGIAVTVTNTMMNTLQDRVALARDVLDFVGTLTDA